LISLIRRRRQGGSHPTLRLCTIVSISVELVCHVSSIVGRLMSDAKYLHQKLLGLKHIGTPTSMLETVIAERRIGRPGDVIQEMPPRSDSASNHQQRPSSRSSTMNAVTANANQRLRVLLSGRSPTLQTGTPPTPPPLNPRTSFPGPMQASSSSVTSFLTPGGVTPQGSSSTITLVDSGDVANEDEASNQPDSAVSNDTRPEASSGMSRVVDIIPEALPETSVVDESTRPSWLRTE
jgi:hypothetical protein